MSNALMSMYGHGYRRPVSDGLDYTSADVLGQIGANKRRAEYDNSLLGMVHNWATGEQRQPVQLPQNAPLWDQANEAVARIANLPMDMAAGGAKTMSHWLGAASNPEMVETQDMLAPLGIGAMAGLAGAVPRGAVGSAGGKVAADQSRASMPGLFAGAVDEPKGITAYHGSPHDFDKFSLDKIGTGEGAQAFGHGLYFAESEGVAKYYKDTLSGATRGDIKKNINGRPPASATEKDIVTAVGIWGGHDAAISALQKSYDNHVRKAKSQAGLINRAMGLLEGTDAYTIAEYYRRYLQLVQESKARGDVVEDVPGRMYEVRINADPEDFLDWDKPLSQQSEKIRSALDEVGVPRSEWDQIDDYFVHSKRGAVLKDGEEFVARFSPAGVDVGRFNTLDEAKAAVEPSEKYWTTFLSENEDASNILKANGIPGIRYLDQGSRNTGEGSRNYVLFRDDIIDIVKKYGIAAAASMYGMQAVDEAMASE